MRFRKIDLTDIDGFKIGNAENINKGTGCTVIICEKGAVGGVDVRGGAPATRETDLLKSENTVKSVNAVVLSGGSAFGLEAASGVMSELSDMGVGTKVGNINIPIVCGASLFDLAVGDSRTYPDKKMGMQACRNAYAGIFNRGNSGAGTGASVGKILGMKRAMKTGLGTFACADGYVQVGAVAAVNAVGDVYNGAGNIISGLRTKGGDSIYGSIKALKLLVHSKNTIKSSTDSAGNSKSLSSMKNKTEIVDAIRNAFSNKIRDMAITEEERTIIIPEDALEDMMIDDCFENITDDAESVKAAEASGGETDSVNAQEYLDENENLKQLNVDEDMGYNIPFNTTISCLLTNAKMTKAQANKLASILHDAYARAIKPVHSTMDGDTIFVLTTGKREVNFDAFAALATDVLQYAIIDAATSAKSAYGLPAACDINR